MSETQEAAPRLRPRSASMDYRRAGFWKGQSLIEYVEAHASRMPAKVALIDARGSLTYADVCLQSSALANALYQRQVKRGDVVAIQAPNWSELVLTHLACNRIGAIFLPLHEGFREQEITHLLTSTRASTLIYPAEYRGFDYRPLVARVKNGAPWVKLRIVLRSAPSADEEEFDALCSGDPLSADTAAEIRTNSTFPSQIMVSSGTTALPRCSLYCDDATAFKLIEQYGRYACGLRESDVAAAIAPAATGATGYSFPILAPLLHGASAVLLEHWNGQKPEVALRLIENYRCTYAVAIPTQLAKIVGCPTVRDYDYRNLRFISNAGAKLAVSIADKAEGIFGCPIQTIYGASDGGVPTMTKVSDDLEKRRSVGRVLIGQELRIIGPGGEPLPANEPGEIIWRGANCCIGYFGAEATPFAAWDNDGWYHSGDLGTIGSDGCLHVVGRSKDVIIRGGRNINIGHIEQTLAEHPGLIDVAIVPVPDDLLGELAGVVLIVKPGYDAPSLAGIAQFLDERGIAMWLRPERLLIVDEFPKNAGGKIDKRKLVDMFGRSLSE